MNNKYLKKDIEEAKIPNLILSHLAGSHAYGMSTPQSDIDVRGIFCADDVNIRTPFFPYKEQTITSMEDAKVYELSNFMKLYTEGNPNILETLWVDWDDIITHEFPYLVLRDKKEDLLSKKLAFTFSGYAISQLKRIKGHNKWITQEDRGVKGLTSLLKEEKITVEWLSSNFTENIVEKVING